MEPTSSSRYLFRLRGGAPPIPPRKPLIQHHIPLVHGTHQSKYICSCGNNQEANACTCSRCQKILRNDNSPCSYYGRCVEPLAWNIEHELVRNQSHCPLFVTIPKEIRDLIFEYALTDNKRDSLEGLLRRHTARFRPTNGGRRPNLHDLSATDVAVNLLRTCRAIYLDTWTLPLSLNPFIYDVGNQSNSNMDLNELLPWQLALIQSLDITVQQFALEGKNSRLYQYLHRWSTWQAEERHKGVSVAPRRYKTNNRPVALARFPVSFNFTLVPVEKDEPRHFLSHILSMEPRPPSHSQPPWSSGMRVMRARPIVHLTLRLQHSDWWTWADHPSSTDELQHLGLDPTAGDGTFHKSWRSTASRMKALAERRRKGDYPEPPPSQGWAATIGELPDLKRLELVLETFRAKKKQLDAVIEAAKTWKFPIVNTQYELTWDGEVGMSGWSTGIDDALEGDSWHSGAKEFEVRVIRFTRRRVS